MQTMFVGVTEAKRRMEELVIAAENGREVIITKRGKPVAKLEPLFSADRPGPGPSPSALA